jgi:hypothetical protein
MKESVLTKKTANVHKDVRFWLAVLSLLALAWVIGH